MDHFCPRAAHPPMPAIRLTVVRMNDCVPLPRASESNRMRFSAAQGRESDNGQCLNPGHNDGCHRLYKAARLGREHLPSFVLTAAETLAIGNFPTLPARFRQAVKDLCYALLAGDLPPGERESSPDTIRVYFTALKQFLTWADQRGIPALRAVTAADLDAYNEHLLASGWAVTYQAQRRQAVRLLWLYADKLTSDALTVDPALVSTWADAPASGRAAENATPRIPEQVISPLLTCTGVDHGTRRRRHRRPGGVAPVARQHPAQPRPPPRTRLHRPGREPGTADRPGRCSGNSDHRPSA